MKILSRQEFLALDEEVVFTSQAEGHEYIFSNLSIKGETIYDFEGVPIDFYYLDLICPIEHSGSTQWADFVTAAHKDSSLSLRPDYECGSRDGMFDEKEKYVVLDKSDLKKFINRLQEVLEGKNNE